MAERFGSGGSKADAVELRDCLPGRRGHADELAIPMRLRRPIAPAPWSEEAGRAGVSDWHVLADLGYAGHLPTGVGPVLCRPRTRPRSWLTWTRSHGISPPSSSR